MWSCEITKIKKRKTYFPWTFMNAFTGKKLVFSDIDLQLKSCLWCLKTWLICHNESKYTLLHLLHRAAPSTRKVVCRGRLRLLWLWLKLVEQAISYTIKKPHYALSFYWSFFFVLGKNHRYINIEFASFFKIEFHGIKLRSSFWQTKDFQMQKFFLSFGPAPPFGSYQGVTLRSYPQTLLCSVFVPDVYNLLLWKSLFFFHFKKTKDRGYI